jgi:hypothetical protein
MLKVRRRRVRSSPRAHRRRVGAAQRQSQLGRTQGRSHEQSSQVILIIYSL